MKLRRNLSLLRGPMDMTPLIDVVFLLLIFFMLSRAFILQPGLKIEVPTSLYGAGIQTNNLVISVMMDPEKRDAAGVLQKRQILIFFNDQLYKMETLKAALARIASGRTGVSVVIKADKSVPHGYIVELMNIALAQGLTVVMALQTNHDSPRP